MKKLDRIVFMGSPDYALPSLMALHQAYPGKIVGVITQPDRPQGRHRHTLVPTAIKQRAVTLELPVFRPESKTEIHETIDSLSPDVVIVIAYGRILDAATVANFFCINAHGSLLPHYRGASPVQSSLLHNDQTTGITLIKMDQHMDTGPILAMHTHSIPADMHFPELFEALSNLSAKTILNFLTTQWCNESLTFQDQDPRLATYCRKISRADAQLLSSDSSEVKWGKIKAYSGNVGAWMSTSHGVVKILRASFTDTRLTPEIIQPEGKKPMPYSDYLRGRPEGLTI